MKRDERKRKRGNEEIKEEKGEKRGKERKVTSYKQRNHQRISAKVRKTHV